MNSNLVERIRARSSAGSQPDLAQAWSGAVLNQPSKLAAASATPAKNAPTLENSRSSIRTRRVIIPPSHATYLRRAHLGKKVTANCQIWEGD
jgi:hypothetical protein